MNAREAALIGHPAQQLLGHSFWEFFPESPDRLLHREMGRAITERVPVELEYFDERTCRWLEKRAYPVLSENSNACSFKQLHGSSSAVARPSADGTGKKMQPSKFVG